jgi:endonuclease YncB( thermonuclease family)
MAFLRAFGISAVAAGVLTLGVSSVPPAPAARADAATATLSAPTASGRVEIWNRPLAPTRADAAGAPSSASPTAPWSLFAPQPSASLVQARFARAGSPALQYGTLAQTGSAPEWHERELADVAVVDGRTLDAAGLRIRLSGLALPLADETCRTLDGRIEACATRAATQLELIIRHRKVTCRYQASPSGEADGSCRIGSSDLAERLVKTGYVRRLDAADAAKGRVPPI